MTKLREGVNLRSLEQRSPLNIYIEDGNNLFEKMKSDIVRDVINGICKLSLPNETAEITDALDMAKIKQFDKKKVQNFFRQTDKSNNLISQPIDYSDNKTIPTINESNDNLEDIDNFEMSSNSETINNIESQLENYENKTDDFESIENEKDKLDLDYIQNNPQEIVSELQDDLEIEEDKDVFFDEYPNENISLNEIENNFASSDAPIKLIPTIDNQIENINSVEEDNSEIIDNQENDEQTVNKDDFIIDDNNNLEDISNNFTEENENDNLVKESEETIQANDVNEFEDIQPEFTPDVSIDEYANNLRGKVPVNQEVIENDKPINPEIISDQNLVKPSGKKLSELKPKMKRYNPNEDIQQNPHNPKYLFNPYYKETDVDNILSRDFDEAFVENESLFDFDMWDDDDKRTQKIHDNNFKPVLIKKNEIEIEDINIEYDKPENNVHTVFDKDIEPIDSKPKVTVDSEPVVYAKNVVNSNNYPDDFVITPHVTTYNKNADKLSEDTFESLKKEFKFNQKDYKDAIETEIIKETAKNYYDKKYLEKKNRKTFDQQLMDLIVEKSKSN